MFQQHVGKDAHGRQTPMTTKRDLDEAAPCSELSPRRDTRLGL